MCECLSTWIKGAFAPSAENSGRHRQKTPMKMHMQPNVFMFFFFTASPYSKIYGLFPYLKTFHRGENCRY
jgi:hypothetical protein